MKLKLFLSFTLVLMVLLLSACGSANDDSSKSKENESKKANAEEDKIKDLYNEVGETFEVIEGLSDAPVDVTVKKIWMEDANKHKDYYGDQADRLDDDSTLTFINYTVKNKSDKEIRLGELIPRYFGSDASLDEIDLSYPKNDLAKEYYDAFSVIVKPGEELDLTGVKSTSIYSKVNGAFIWEFLEDIPQVVFQTPQSERKDAIGTYDIGEPIYVMDNTEDHQLIVTIKDVKTPKETEFENVMDNGNGDWIVVKLEVENTGKEKKDITLAEPSVRVGDKEALRGTEYKKDGKHLEDAYNGPEANLEPGDKANLEIFINVKKGVSKKAQLYYMDTSFLRNKEFGQKLNYNLD